MERDNRRLKKEVVSNEKKIEFLSANLRDASEELRKRTKNEKG